MGSKGTKSGWYVLLVFDTLRFELTFFVFTIQILNGPIVFSGRGQLSRKSETSEPGEIDWILS